jgi:zinc protease
VRKSLGCHGLVHAALICAALICAVLAGPSATAAEWPRTDIAPDPAIRLGVLPNGMRYAIMRNQTPAGAVSVRFSLAVGSSHEAPDQRGFSHFVEHMAFRGSKNFPDGEINRSLERLGLRFGADTNAATGQDMTVYIFNLPTADPGSIADALAITRDIAGNVSFDPRAVETEAGVVMSEAAMRGTPSRRAGMAQLEFLLADARASAMPGSDPTIIEHPSAPDLLRYYRAYYRPERAVLTIVGDIDPDQLATQIAARFGDWRGTGQGGSDPVFKVPTNRGLEARIRVEAGAPARVTLTWVQPALPHPGDRADWKRRLINSMALQIANRRLAAIAAAADPPFAGAAAGQQDARSAAQLYTLSASLKDALVGSDGTTSESWQKPLVALAQTRLALLRTPVSQAETDSVVADQKAAAQRAEMSADTRTTPALASALAANAMAGDIAVSPAQQRGAGEETLAGLTPDRIGQALHEMFGAGDPLIFVSSPRPLRENETAVMDAYRAAVEDTKPPSATAQAMKWPYTSFGPPGRVVETESAPDIGVTSLRFANNVRLLVRPSRLRLNQVLVSVKLGNGRLGLPKDRPVPSWLFGGIVPAGLGALSATEMVTALSGKNYRVGFGVGDGTFAFSGQTTSQDLETQLQVFAAYIKDPGFRAAGFEQFKQQSIARLRAADATPAGVMALMSPGILHGGDKRWAAPTLGEIGAVTIDEVQALARPIFAETPMEVVIAGDTTVEAATQAVAATLGALPARPDQSLKLTPDNDVAFPAGAAPVVLQASTPSSQALVSMAWATRGYFSDLKDDAALHLLAAILQERLLDAVRGQGLSYAVQVAMPSSATFDYGYILALATMPAGKAPIFYDAADRIAADLKAGRIDADAFARSRAPTLQDLRNTIQMNDYWLGLLNNGWDVQARFNRARSYEQILESVTPEDVAAVARKYLTAARMVRISTGP